MRGAADLDSTAAAGVVGPRVAEVVGRVDRVRLQVGALAAEAHLDRAGLGTVEVVQQEQPAGAGVDDAGAVGGGLPRVEAAVRHGGVAAQVRAVGEAGVDRADALVVGEEGDPVPHPHRVLHVAVQAGVDPLELPSPVRSIHNLPAVPPR